MKTLYIVRHAKSSWKDLSLADFDRPLNKRGQNDAPFMAQKLKDMNISVDKIISSPALRAKTTAEVLYSTLEIENELEFDSKIYDYHFESIEPIVKLFDNNYSDIILVGHNPSLNEFVGIYLGLEDNIPTNGVIGINFDIEQWDEVSPKKAQQLFFIYPKLYNK